MQFQISRIFAKLWCRILAMIKYQCGINYYNLYLTAGDIRTEYTRVEDCSKRKQYAPKEIIMPKVLYKACVFNEVHVNLSNHEYQVLFGTGASAATRSKETITPILVAASGRAIDLILPMKTMKCFRCEKQAGTSVNSPTSWFYQGHAFCAYLWQ